MTLPEKSLSYSRYALALLMAVNLLNYVDRQVLYAVFPLIKADLALSDTALGFLGSSFMICYLLSAPFLGFLGDRWSRRGLASAGLTVWSLATALAGVAPGYRTLLAARTVVGIGEASFGTVSPGLIADFFPKERRGRVLSWFYLAIPVGSALGYLLGGVLGHRFGWHAAFLMVGVPGLLLAIPVALLREPPRGGDEVGSSMEKRRGYGAFFSNRSFVCNTLAMAAMTFAMGGLAQWLPSFLNRVHHVDVEKGNFLFGLVTVLAGILGTAAGGWLGDRWQKRTRKGYLFISGWGFLIGTPITACSIMADSLAGCLAAAFLAEFFLFLNTGPLNTVIVNVTKPSVRAMAFAVNIFFIHALGDAVSPTILGWLSDHWGLRGALLVTPAAVALAGIFCFVCSRYVEADMARAEGEPAP
ncbi:MFS transporter [Geomonas sp. RF6]|uniref:spinster family MFS transporter n=1 Tax=Geomonas sp. RF6 TaxID=2897342 RepID=UPI001E374936|nr:MFS transporter [Geomonas sp. RF6]UFS71512.1 MFS transporter [Geomonas sp. RF6]